MIWLSTYTCFRALYLLSAPVDVLYHGLMERYLTAGGAFALHFKLLQ
jgi:hypothetical protein